MNIKGAIQDQVCHDSLLDWRAFSHVIFCSDKSNAAAFAARFASSFPDKGRLLVICVGLIPDGRVVRGIAEMLLHKKVIILMHDDLLGRVSAIKIAVWLRQKEVYVFMLSEGQVEIVFNGKRYLFADHKICLSAFEKVVGFRSKIRTIKALP